MTMKTGATLSPELVSLVHHIELNKVGWWNQAVARLIVAALWIGGKPVTRAELSRYLASELHIATDEARLRDQVLTLTRSGDVIELPDGRLKLTERAFGKFEADIRQENDNRNRVRTRFLEKLQTCCPQIATDKTWDAFNTHCLIPWIKNTGAPVYALVAGDPFNVDTLTSAEPFLLRFDAASRDGLRLAVASFADPMTPDLRHYILAYLGTFFVLESSSLREETLSRVFKPGRTADFRVFLDTNFVFSMLAIHDNPSNAAALAVVEMIGAVSGKTNIKMYVSPATVDEIKRALYGRIRPLQGIALHQPVAAAGVNALSGLERQYLEHARTSAVPMDPEEYFGPYLRDLITVLRKHGVELYNEPMESYTTRQTVIDDVALRLEYERKHFGEKARSYDQLMHDVSLWHLVRDQRSAVVESPLDAVSWVLTVDYHLLGFDAYKQRGAIPVCLHPAAFIQLLQFWIPRTEEFEDALIGSLGLGSLFRVNTDTEKVTVQILNALSKFENATDLSQDTVGKILVNDALRQKIRTARDAEAQVAAIREALIEENNRIASALASAAKRERDLQAELEGVRRAKEQQESESRAAVERTERERVEAAQLAAQRAEELSEAKRAVDELAREKDEIRRLLDETKAEDGRRARLTSFALFAVTAGGLGLAEYYLLHQVHPAKFAVGNTKPSFVTALGVSSAVIAWLLSVEALANALAAVRESRLFARIRAFRAWLLGGSGIGSLLLTLYFEYVRSTF